jgi:hypothetical protein
VALRDPQFVVVPIGTIVRPTCVGQLEGRDARRLEWRNQHALGLRERFEQIERTALGVDHDRALDLGLERRLRLDETGVGPTRISFVAALRLIVNEWSWSTITMRPGAIPVI